MATISAPKKKVGRPRFEPTDEQRATVERAAGLGFTQDKICALLGGMSKHTLENHFREELDRGIALIQYKVGSSLVDNALNGNVNAQMFYLSRQVGWKETTVVENKDVRAERRMKCDGSRSGHRRRAVVMMRM